MGGRKPKAPRIIPGQPPMGKSPGLIGSVIGGARSALLGTPSGRRRRSFAEDARTGNLPEIDFRMELQGGYRPDGSLHGSSRKKPLPKGALRGLATPPPGSEFTDDNRLIKRGSETIYPSKGRRGRVRGRKPSRKLTNEEKMRIRSKYEARRKTREEKGFAKRGSKDKQGRPVSPTIQDHMDRSDRRTRGRRMRPRGSRPDIQLGGRRGRRPSAVMETTRVPVKDPTLGGPPEREVPIPKETLPAITRESDPTGPAPFAPNERAMAQDRFFERMFEKADARKQQESMMREERGRVKQSMRDEMRMRMNDPGEINVGGEININAERRPRPRRRRRMRRMRR